MTRADRTRELIELFHREAAAAVVRRRLDAYTVLREGLLPSNCPSWLLAHLDREITDLDRFLSREAARQLRRACPTLRIGGPSHAC